MKYANYIKVLLPFLVLAGLFIFKQYYLDEVSDKMASRFHDGASSETYEEFNLTRKSTAFRGTLLEFGATNCSVCRQMEKVLSELSEKYSHNIDIKFMNTTEKEGLIIGRKFGMIAIPMQVLLDEKGKVVFKHIGYISAEDLSDKIDHLILKPN